MLPNVADYIHVERGIIPRDVCEKLRATIEQREWRPNAWYNPVKNQVTSDAAEPDMLFADGPQHTLLEPSIQASIKRYSAKYTYKQAKTQTLLVRVSAVRFNRYAVGQGMSFHHDHINLSEGQQTGIPVLSFVGNLNEDYEGGDLVFFEGRHPIALKTGDICMFPSCFLYPHHVEPVRRGTRYSFAAWGW